MRTGRLDVIDLVDADTKTLVANNLHFGLGVDAARRAQSLKSAVGRFAYPIATAYEGADRFAGHFEVHGDGDLVWSGPALAVLVLLGPSMGGGVEVVPDRSRHSIWSSSGRPTSATVSPSSAPSGEERSRTIRRCIAIRS